MFVELVGKTGATSPEHIGVTAANVGVISGLTVIVKVAVVAQSPAVGENVYVPVVVLLTTGDHVPVIAGVFVELVGKTGATSPEQIGVTAANVGVINGLTVIVKVVVPAHCPAAEVKV